MIGLERDQAHLIQPRLLVYAADRSQETMPHKTQQCVNLWSEDLEEHEG